MKLKTTSKTPLASRTETTHIVQPQDINPIGTIFGGTVMAWIDLAAAACANRHTRKVCVTASMDELHFLSPIHLGEIVILKANVNYTHRTSLEVGVRVESEDPFTGERRHTASAYLTFVALDKKGSPTPVPPVLPQTAQEKMWFEEARVRRIARLSSKGRRRTSKGNV
ncbi:MAG: acyl-CoA thioesterase [Deltaproteobacteria bacterium]|nr:acyl-CoA thioesterase [Deltaproteobacteria bacterium]